MMKTFRYALLVLGIILISSQAHSQGLIAYDLSTASPPSGAGPSYIGQQAYGGMVGMEFDVNSPGIKVTSLGVFDSGRDGFHNVLTAYIFDRDTHAIVTSLSFSGTSGTLIGYNRFENISGDLVLNPGHYIIAAEGFSSADPLGNVIYTGFVPDTFNSDGGVLSAVGDGVYGSNLDPPGTYPNLVESGSGSLAFNAATFNFTLYVPEPGSVIWLLCLAGGSLGYRSVHRHRAKKRV